MGIYSKIKKEHVFIFLILLTMLILFNYFDFGYSGLITKRTCYSESYSCCNINEGEGFNYFSLDESCPSNQRCYESCKYEDVKNLVTGDVSFIDSIVDFFKDLFGKKVVGEETFSGKEVILMALQDTGEIKFKLGYNCDYSNNKYECDDWSGLQKLDDFDIEIALLSGELNEECASGDFITGAGVAIGDINGDGKNEIIFMGVDNRGKPDYFIYKIGHDCNLDNNGDLDCTWEEKKEVEGVGDCVDGADVEIYNYDSDAQGELFFIGVDDPSGANKFRYRILNCDNSYNCNLIKKDELSTGLGSDGEGAGFRIGNILGEQKAIFIFVDGAGKLWRYDTTFTVSNNNFYFDSLPTEPIEYEIVGNQHWGGGLELINLDDQGDDEFIIMALDSNTRKWYYRNIETINNVEIDLDDLGYYIGSGIAIGDIDNSDIGTVGGSCNNEEDCLEEGTFCNLTINRCQNTQCNDNLDNDYDGYCDYSGCIIDDERELSLDPQCVNIDDNSEESECSNGVDDDNDNFIDYGRDYGCSTANDNSESQGGQSGGDYCNDDNICDSDYGETTQNCDDCLGYVNEGVCNPEPLVNGCNYIIEDNNPYEYGKPYVDFYSILAEGESIEDCSVQGFDFSGYDYCCYLLNEEDDIGYCWKAINVPQEGTSCDYSNINANDGKLTEEGICVGCLTNADCGNNLICSSDFECVNLNNLPECSLNVEITSDCNCGGQLASSNYCCIDNNNNKIYSAQQCNYCTNTQECDSGYNCINNLCKPYCNDGIDNDNDGKIDYGTGINNDPGCESVDSIKEDPECDDSVDNDEDEGIDKLPCTASQANNYCGTNDIVANGLIFSTDPQCTYSYLDDESGAIIETNYCNDGIDNDGDGKCDIYGCKDSNNVLIVGTGPDTTCTSSSGITEDNKNPDITYFYPGEELINERRPEIKVSFSDDSDNIGNVLLKLDNNVIIDTIINGVPGSNFITYTLDNDLNETNHNLSFIVTDRLENYNETNWTFIVNDLTYPQIIHNPLRVAYNGTGLQINATVYEKGSGINYVRFYSSVCVSTDITPTGAVTGIGLDDYCDMVKIDENTYGDVYSYTIPEIKINNAYLNNEKITYYIEARDNNENIMYSNGTNYTDLNDLTPVEVIIKLKEDCSNENNNKDSDNAVAALDSDCEFNNKIEINNINVLGLRPNNISYKDSTLDIICSYKVVNNNEIQQQYIESAYNCVKAKIGNIECGRTSIIGSSAQFMNCNVGNSLGDKILSCYLDNNCKQYGNNKESTVKVEDYKYCSNYNPNQNYILIDELNNIGGSYDHGDIIEINPKVYYYSDDNKKLKVNAAIIDIRNNNKVIEQVSNEVNTYYGSEHQFSLSLDVPVRMNNGVYKIFVKAYNTNEEKCSQVEYPININEAECIDEDEDNYCSYEDCDDANESINPSIVEICSDNLDNDCDNLIDNLDSNCIVNITCVEGSTETCNTGLQGICNEGIKTCINGVYSGCVQTNQATIEQCTDNLDNDCDGKTDCSDSDCSNLPVCEVSGPSLEEDTDNDGIDDVWELQYFDTLNQGPSADYDGDGVNNFQEFLDDTDPTNKSDYLKKTSYMWLFYIVGIIILIIAIVFIVLKYFKPKKKSFSKGFYSMPSTTGDIRLKNYVKDSLRKGFSKEQIKRALKTKGWKDKDIEDAFR